MASLPKTLSFSAGRDLAFLVVHGGIDIINRFVFRSQRPEIAAELERADADVVIAGHCGIPFIEKIEQRVWFNPGVIGMPANDGTPDTWYGLIETRGDHIALSTHRSGYDHYSAAAAMRKWAHANAYARSLIRTLAQLGRVADRRKGVHGHQDTGGLAHRQTLAGRRLRSQHVPGECAALPCTCPG
jgi:hypothetical protein